LGNAYGIAISLLISLLLLIPQVQKRDFNLMDVVSFTYFLIALIGTFVLKMNIFVENSGFLGYVVLFFMASISLVLKKPYTLQVSKRDYPEIYWKDKSFLAINNAITLIWSIVFFSKRNNIPFI
jgi:all-trans-retinol 13,14-reductase